MEYIAALELGSSKMIAMVASINDRKKILARATVESGDSIRRGLIYKTAEASSKIAELIRRLKWELQQARLPALRQVYVGIGGQGLHTKAYSVEKILNGNIVDDEILDQLRDECQIDWKESFELIDKISPEYYVDGNLELQPQGIRCDKLKARFQMVLGHFSDFKTEVEKVLRRESIEMVDMFVAPIATAKQVLTEQEKKRGCALIEFGAGLTYLSIYKSGLLRYLIAIPLGSNVITKDLCSLDKSEAESEKLKVIDGCVHIDDETNEFHAVIEARVDEIVMNILHQIEISGYESALKAGFIITGGASRLKGLDRLLEQRTDKSIRWVEENPEQSCIRGLLQLGNENCAKDPVSRWGLWSDLFGNDKIEVQPQEKKKPKKNLMQGIKNKAEAATEKVVKDLFD